MILALAALATTIFAAGPALAAGHDIRVGLAEGVYSVELGGGPAGLEAIAATINDEAETLAEVVEPFLLKVGFIVRTPSGRRATGAAYAHLGYARPAREIGQGELPLS